MNKLQHALRDHVVDRVAAAAADADHLDLRVFVELFDHFDGHVVTPSTIAVAKHFGG